MNLFSPAFVAALVVIKPLVFADVEVDPELIELFRGYRAKATRSFVIESPNDPRPDATFQHYRCQYLFEKLSEWLWCTTA